MIRNTWAIIHLCSYGLLLAALPWGLKPTLVAVAITLTTGIAYLLCGEGVEMEYREVKSW